MTRGTSTAEIAVLVPRGLLIIIIIIVLTNNCASSCGHTMKASVNHNGLKYP